MPKGKGYRGMIKPIKNPPKGRINVSDHNQGKVASGGKIAPKSAPFKNKVVTK